MTMLLSPREVAQVIYDNVPGWREYDTLVDAVRIAFAESGKSGYYRASRAGYVASPAGFRVCDANMRFTNADGSIDRGLFQVNNKFWPALTDAQADDPALNAKFAYQIYVTAGKKFTPWAAFNNLQYQQFWQEGVTGPALAWLDRKNRNYYIITS